MWYAAGKSLKHINGLPQMKAAFTNWKLPIQLIKLTQSTVNFQTVTTETIINFKGVIQPLKAEEIKLKPEEQRAWKWLQVHTEDDLSLLIGEKLKYNNVKHRVMFVKDFNEYN
jgi:hypothetical protein